MSLLTSDPPQRILPPRLDPLKVAAELAAELAKTAVERDRQGSTPKPERDRIRASGLLNLIIPQAYGGWGQDWPTAFGITRQLAAVDSSIAHVYSYHHLGVVIPHIFGSEEQREAAYRETVRHTWFWGNALNPLDQRTFISRDGDGFRLTGQKSFCSGALDSDRLPVSALDPDTKERVVLVIPTQRSGVTLHDDWNNMGQRQTDSGSITFDHVKIEPEEVLKKPPSPFGSIRACLTQLNLANIFLGIAQGAFQVARDYTRTQTRPWLTSGVDKATQDPYLLERYGDLWLELQAATHLTDHVGSLLQAAWDQQEDLSAAQRGETAVAIAAAKVASTRIGLTITHRMFELMGARSTSGAYGLDRFWRNLRTLSLHDPVDYKVRLLGDWALNDRIPDPDFYQ